MTTPKNDSRAIPGLPADHQLPDDVVDAYWVAMELAGKGWGFKSFGYDPASDTATVAAFSPGGRAVTVHKSVTEPLADHPTVDRALSELARAVARLGYQDRGSGVEMLLTQLRWLVQSGIKNPVRQQIRARTDRLPTLPETEQPNGRVRTAAWTIAHLVVIKRWHIAALGQDIAGGGFIAEIPGEGLYIYPAGGNGDGTPAGALAGMLEGMGAEDIALLASLDYRQLYAAGHGAKK
jgi:hypothetical protein